MLELCFALWLTAATPPLDVCRDEYIWAADLADKLRDRREVVGGFQLADQIAEAERYREMTFLAMGAASPDATVDYRLAWWIEWQLMRE